MNILKYSNMPLTVSSSLAKVLLFLMEYFFKFLCSRNLFLTLLTCSLWCIITCGFSFIVVFDTLNYMCVLFYISFRLLNSGGQNPYVLKVISPTLAYCWACSMLRYPKYVVCGSSFLGSFYALT